MGCRLAFLLACALAWPSPGWAQNAEQHAEPDGVALLLARLQHILETGSGEGFETLVGGEASTGEIREFTDSLFTPGTRRAVVLERDRVPLDGALPGDGFRVVAELFTESPTRARIVTAQFDVRRPVRGAPDSWRIVGARGTSAVDGLFKLAVNRTKQFAARGVTITAEDLVLTQTEGSVFLVEGEGGITGLVLMGRGVMRFAPAPETERGQLRIFAGSEVLDAPFETAFIRLSPTEYDFRVSQEGLTPVPVNPRELRRAEEVFAREAPKSFSLDLRDLSPDMWYLVPPTGDFLAEVRTRRHGTLTYTRASTQSEDISLFERERRRTIALYPSISRRAEHGLAFNEDDRRDYDVLDYDIEASVAPDTGMIDAQVRMRVRVRSHGLPALTLRLADELTVRSIGSPEYGRLLFLRVRDQDNVIVNFPAPLPAEAEVTLLVSYGGRLESQDIEDETVQAGSGDDLALIPTEPNFLLSSRAYWYPQNPIVDYATGTLRVIVPEGYGCVASGEPRGSTDVVTLRDLLRSADGRSHVFTARDPIRYFALVVSRFMRVGESSIELDPDHGDPAAKVAVSLAVDANPRQQGRGRAALADVSAVMKYYASLLGDAPYSSMTVALLEHELPGGHSPGYFVMLNNQIPTSRASYRNDPASFSSFPEFFIAHEVAHQWWGQAVGWRNYHDQWLSEGFAQYFAALYARHARGERTFNDMLRQFRRWAISESEEGPISLGSRLGHIRRQPRVFRALVYNKGAGVLHMLRQLVGDDAFFAGLRRFYGEQKFRKAGTDDLRIAIEKEAGRPLSRFFDQWIYGTGIPELRYTSTISPGVTTVAFEQVDTVFDVPVTVSLVYADGRVVDTVVPVVEQRVDWKMETTGTVRQVQINRDDAAIAEFSRF
jgi:hypothetical protein